RAARTASRSRACPRRRPGRRAATARARAARCRRHCRSGLRRCRARAPVYLARRHHYGRAARGLAQGLACPGGRMAFAARATRAVSLLAAGLALALVAACAPSKVAAPRGPAQPAPLAPSEAAPPPVAEETLPPPALALPPPVEPPPVVLDGKTRVGIVLPLTGRDGAIGRALLDAAELAVFDFGDDHFVLN